MKLAIEQFRENIQRIKNLGDLYAYLATKTAKTELDMSDILRAEVVLIVSALDTFIHDIVRLGMLEILRGEREQTPKYRSFSVTMNFVSFDEEYNWFERTVRKKHKESTFQRAEKIKEAVSYISKKDIWELVVSKFDWEKDYFTKRLNLIVDRRNQIAHESDIDPSFPNTRYSIDPQEIREMVAFIEEIVEAIYAVLKQ